MADDLIAIVVAGGGSRRLGRLAGAGAWISVLCRRSTPPSP